MQHVMMVGAGSVGGYFGAHLAKHNPNVSFLLRPKTLAAVQRQGLTIRSASGTLVVHPPSASDPRQLPKPDLIILAVKAYDLDEVMTQIEPVLTDRTVILTLQNGIDTEDRIIARLKRDCVVGGVAFIYSKIVSPGVIDHYKKGNVAIGELMGHESERLLQIRDLFVAAGIPCQLSKDIRRSKWEKMCWNCAFNPLTVLIDDKVSKALDHPEMMRVIHQIVGEITAVSAALKVPLPADMPEHVVKWTQEIRDIHTSMYDDWKAGRQTEIRNLNGYITDQGRALGIPTPVNEALTAMIKTITEKEQIGPTHRSYRWSSGAAGVAGPNGDPAASTRASGRRCQSGHAEDEGVCDHCEGIAGGAGTGNPRRPCDLSFQRREICRHINAPTGRGLWLAALRTRWRAVARWKGRAVSVDYSRARRSLCKCERGRTH